jgi:hypothetical protein
MEAHRSRTDVGATSLTGMPARGQARRSAKRTIIH